MDEDEDWDLPNKVPDKPAQQNNNSTPHQTLKITDGYKYSYEALSSPANIDDWVEGPSYGASRRSSSGYSQSSFRDNKSFRNEKISSSKRFDSLKHNDSFSSNSSPRNFSTPKPSRFSNRSNTGASNDWDAPSNSTSQTNGSWKRNANASVTEEDWDDPTDAVPQNHKSIPNVVEIPMYNPNNSKKTTEDENWDAVAGLQSKNDKISHNESQSTSTNNENKDKFWDKSNEASSKRKTNSEMDMYNSDSSMCNLEQRNSTNNMEENWDADPSDQSVSNSSRNGFAKDIPLYNPSNSNGQPYSNNPFNQRYENNYHSNKHPHSRNYESNDRFSREPFNRHSRGNRHSPYERSSRGRGGRGGRGGRSGRDGSYQSYNSRDNSRNRDRKDSSYQHNSYSKSRNSDRTSYQPPSNSFKNVVVDAEEDWDSPSGFVQKPLENNAPPVPIVPSVEQVEEESWD